MSRFTLEEKCFSKDEIPIRCVLIVYLPPVHKNAKHSSNIKDILSNELRDRYVVTAHQERPEDDQLRYFAFPSSRDRRLMFTTTMSSCSPTMHSFVQTTSKGQVEYGHSLKWRREVRSDATLALVKLQRGLKYLQGTGEEEEEEEDLEKIDGKLTIPVGLVFLTSLPVHETIQKRLRDLLLENDVMGEIEKRIEISDTSSTLTSSSNLYLRELLKQLSSTLKRPMCQDWTHRERVRFQFMTSNVYTKKVHSEHLFVYRSNNSKRTCRFCKIEAFPVVKTCWILSHKLGGSFSFHSMLIPNICSFLYELSCPAGLPEICVPLQSVLEQVLPINMIALFTCVLLDIPVVAVSEMPNRLTNTMESVLALLYPLPVDRLRVYVPLCPESTFRNVVHAPFPFVLGVTLSKNIVEECVDPTCVIMLNLDEQDEVLACRDVLKRFEVADVPLLPPRFLRRIVRSVYQSFPRSRTHSSSSKHKFKIQHKRSSNGLVRWFADRFRNLTSSPSSVCEEEEEEEEEKKKKKEKYSSISITGRALQLMASSDENEGSTVMDPKMSLRYEKLLDSGDIMSCPAVSNEWELRNVTRRNRIKFARWGFASVLASLIKFYPFHIQNVSHDDDDDDDDDSEKTIRRPFRTLFDKGAFLTECRHSEKERLILDRIVDTQLFHAFIRDRLQDQLPTPFEKWCLHKLLSINTQRSSFANQWRSISGFVYKLPRGRRAPSEDIVTEEVFLQKKNEKEPPMQLSGWKRRYAYIAQCRKDNTLFALRYHDASKVENIQSGTDWNLVSKIRSASHRRDSMRRLLSSSFRGEFILSKDPQKCRIRLLNDNRVAKYKTPHVLEILSEADEKGSIVLCMETSEERMLWIRTLKGLQHEDVIEKLKMKRVSFEKKLDVVVV